MPRNLALALALLLLIVCGVVHGWWSERWHTSAELSGAVAVVEGFPLVLGDWQGEPLETDARAFARMGAQGHWMRKYTNARTGQSVLAVLMCGRPGTMGVHTPELCYRSADFELHDTPVDAPVRGAAGEDLGTLYSARFARVNGPGAGMRMYWGWNDGGGWQAPGNPRWTFRGQTYLYKLYVTYDMLAGQEEDAAAEFLKRLLPELRQESIANPQG